MQQSVKKPPTKKRHTKPCKFFQTDRCPLTAEECNFAHVLSNEVSFVSPTPCRFFAAGNCGNGARCRFRHATGDPEGQQRHIHPRTESRHMHPNATVWSAQTPAPPRDSIPPHSLTPRSPSFPTYSNTETSKIYSTSPGGWIEPISGDAGRPFSPPNTVSLSSSLGSGASLSTSGSSSFNDDPIFVTEDPQYSEHPHQHQSQVRVVDDLPMVHVPPFYASMPIPHDPLWSPEAVVPEYPYPYNAYGFSATSPRSPASSVPKPVARSRHKNYKTKPCKFYKVDKTCPNGDECTFVHENAAERPPTRSPPELHPSLPSKPISAQEENKRRNFFPISWRVIGGGVMMGDSRSLINKSTAPAELGHEDNVEQVPTPRAPSFNQQSGDGRAVSEHPEGSSTPTKSRLRSTSIPSSSRRPRINLFSAESPGGL